MHRHWCALGIISVLFAFTPSARAAETDQFMTWNVELRDSAALINDFLNASAQEFVARRNRSNDKTETVEEMGNKFYLYLFQGLHSSRIRTFVSGTEAIDRFPSTDTSFWQYQRTSIYRGMSFPYLMPMARSIRVGDVYFGIDKVSHFFGFGRRYFQRYLRLIGEGMTPEEALDKVIANGLSQESSLVGGLVDGVISFGDLEANFQGFQMLMHLTQGQTPFFVQQSGQWHTQGQIDFAGSAHHNGFRKLREGGGHEPIVRCRAIAIAANWATSRASPRSEGSTPAASSKASTASLDPAHGARVDRKVLRRWAKAASTTAKTCCRVTSVVIGA